jgi:secreted trypsin-like serine protease
LGLAALLPPRQQHQHPEDPVMKVLVSIAALGLGLSTAANAQATFATLRNPVQSLVVVGDSLVGPGVGIDNPLYLPPSTDNNYSGVVNLWLDDLDLSQRFGCTGSLLSNRQILVAAHCVTTAGAVTTDRFTARFRNADGTFTAVTGTRIAVQANYSGAVLEEQDVAVLTLDSDAPPSARRYTLFQGNPLVDYTMAGFGRTGTGVTGGTNNVANNQFGAINVLRAGRNAFETTANDAASFATAANPNPGAFGGILVSDFDRIGQNTGTPICTALGFCTAGIDRESSIGSGDSGGAAFTNTWEILGVASWGSTTGGVGGLYGSYFGYACVANYAANAACKANYDFVLAQIVPEPSTYLLMVTGFVGLIVIARRRRSI